MNSTQLVQYLANVISVIRADGRLSLAEEAALATICADLGAKSRERKAAEKLVSLADFQLKSAGRYSEQVRNIEDMVFVALADGDLGDAEKANILAFASQIGISQEQISRITSEADIRVKSQSATLVCPKCSAQCQAAAKFCPECGTSIQAKDQIAVTKLEFDYPLAGVAIEFAETTAAGFDAALRLAKTAPSFQEIQRNKKPRFLASWPSETLSDTLELVRHLKGVRNRKVYIEGKECAWDEVFDFLWCCDRRNAAYKPAEYCFGSDEKRPNLWGCKQPRMDWAQWANWFSYGNWISRDVFQFDKNRIKHELETNSHHLRFCPHLRHELLQAVFSLIPDRVRIGERECWKYKENYEQTPNSIKIVQSTSEDGFTYKHEFFTDGVVPTGFEVARSILKRAFSQCGIKDVDVSSILP